MLVWLGWSRPLCTIPPSPWCLRTRGQADLHPTGCKASCPRPNTSPSTQKAASLFLSLISSRYEQSSLIVSSNKSFSAWSEIFGDAVAVAARVDRLVHHAEIIVLKGDSYRLKDKQEEVTVAEDTR